MVAKSASVEIKKKKKKKKKRALRYFELINTSPASSLITTTTKTILNFKRMGTAHSQSHPKSMRMITGKNLDHALRGNNDDDSDYCSF